MIATLLPVIKTLVVRLLLASGLGFALIGWVLLIIWLYSFCHQVAMKQMRELTTPAHI